MLLHVSRCLGLACLLWLVRGWLVVSRRGESSRPSRPGVCPREPGALDRPGGVPRRDPVDDRARPPVDRGPGHLRRWDHARRHQGSVAQSGRLETGEALRRGLLPGGGWCDHAFGLLRRQVGRRARQSRPGERAVSPELSARRHAGFHAGRLQYRELPRGRARQGWISDLALWLRSRRRSLPPHARDGGAADQPGRALG